MTEATLPGAGNLPGTYEIEDVSTLTKVSWGAIFAGTVVALVVQVLLTMLGAGIGIATLDAGGVDNPEASTFSIVAGIWYVLSGIIAAYAGGYIAARMSGKTVPTSGALHGLTTWSTRVTAATSLLGRTMKWSTLQKAPTFPLNRRVS